MKNQSFMPTRALDIDDKTIHHSQSFAPLINNPRKLIKVKEDEYQCILIMNCYEIQCLTLITSNSIVLLAIFIDC